MRNTKFYCFYSLRTGHHKEYYKVLSELVSTEGITSNRKKLKILFSKSSVIFLDIDNYDILYFPLIIFRRLFASKSFAISVRGEDLLKKNEYSKRKKIIGYCKRIVFYCLKNYSNTNLISIRMDERFALNKYYNYFIYDLQLWDLKILKTKAKRPSELGNLNLAEYILIPGRFNHQKSPSELIEYSKKNLTKFIVAGVVENQYLKDLKKLEKVFLINRYCTEEELFYLIKESKAIYCFYPSYVDRPSGFVGRALQLNKSLVIRSGGYLDKSYGSLENVFSIDHLNKITDLNLNNPCEPPLEQMREWDDSETLKDILSVR